MAEMMICDDREDETSDIAGKAKEINAHVSDTKLNIHTFTDSVSCVRAVNEGYETDMAVTSITDEESTRVPENIRAVNDETEILIIADATVPPTRYLTPRIRACSLLLRPYEESVCIDTVRDFMIDYYRKADEDDSAIIVENSGERIKIPVSQIYYIEVKGKKVFIRLVNTEYSEYATFEKVLEETGNRFIRCHRSFAFNKDFFESVRLSENIIRLAHGVTVPLSRSYKEEIKEFVNGFR